MNLGPKEAIGAAKCPLHLVPPTAMEQIAWAHKCGADKYGPYNWRTQEIQSSTYVSAIMRHLNAWRDGEDMDESGCNHLAHIGASVNILLDAAKYGKLIDDRAAGGTVSEIPANMPQFPPVPDGYKRWEHRGKGWYHPFAMYACWFPLHDYWATSDVPEETSACPDIYYIEAVK